MRFEWGNPEIRKVDETPHNSYHNANDDLGKATEETLLNKSMQHNPQYNNSPASQPIQQQRGK